MVLKINCDVEQSLLITISYDDGTSKTKVVSEGDYISVLVNHNGRRECVSGVVSTIRANPYDTRKSKADWYFVLVNDNPGDGPVGAIRVSVSNIIDVEIISMKRQVNAINSPNNSMRVTDIRIKAGYLQVSNNNGRSWKTVGSDQLIDYDVPQDSDLQQKIHNMIGSDQYASSEDFVKGIEQLILEEARKLRYKLNDDEDMSDCDGPKPSLWDHGSTIWD